MLLGLLMSLAHGQTYGDHVGTWDGQAITWSSTFVGGQFCVPLPQGATLQSGRVEGTMACTTGGRVTMTTVQRGEGLQPVLPVHGIHRLTLAHGHFSPESGPRVKKTVTGWSSPDLGKRDRFRADRALNGWRPRTKGQVFYLKNPGERGLKGTLSMTKVTHASRLLFAGLFGGVLVAGFMGYKLLDRLARKEEVDAWLHDVSVASELKKDGIV